MNTMSFNAGDKVVYPAHGVGIIRNIETQEVAGHSLQVFVISFNEERMTLKIPVAKAHAVGLRSLSSTGEIEKAFETLQKKVKIKKAVWGRRAQEYQGKINSGNLIRIAEVVRDLRKGTTQPEPSYSERQLYQTAFGLFLQEYAAVQKVDPKQAAVKLEERLAVA